MLLDTRTVWYVTRMVGHGEAPHRELWHKVAELYNGTATTACQREYSYPREYTIFSPGKPEASTQNMCSEQGCKGEGDS